jgi:hypothetical protein
VNSANYDWVQSSKSITLDPGVYQIQWRLLNIDNGFRTRLDYLDLIEIPSPVRKGSWGSIRALFR